LSEIDRQRFWSLQRLQIFDELVDLGSIELELRHARMSSHDTLGKRLLKIFDGIALMERAERRRNRQRTLVIATDGVAVGAVRLGKDEAAIGAVGVGNACREIPSTQAKERRGNAFPTPWPQAARPPSFFM
jgi:hypothetical protein